MQDAHGIDLDVAKRSGLTSEFLFGSGLLFLTFVYGCSGWRGLTVTGVVTFCSLVPVLTLWGRKRGGYGHNPVSNIVNKLEDGNLGLRARRGGLKLYEKVTQLFLSFYLFKGEIVMGGKWKSWNITWQKTVGKLLSWGEIFAPLTSWGLRCCVIGDKPIKLLGNPLTLPSQHLQNRKQKFGALCKHWGLHDKIKEILSLPVQTLCKLHSLDSLFFFFCYQLYVYQMLFEASFSHYLAENNREFLLIGHGEISSKWSFEFFMIVYWKLKHLICLCV